jgi:hypothetical protein
LKNWYRGDGRIQLRAILRSEFQDARVAGAGDLPDRIFAGGKAVGADLHRLVEGDHNLITNRALPERIVGKNEAQSHR